MWRASLEGMQRIAELNRDAGEHVELLERPTLTELKPLLRQPPDFAAYSRNDLALDPARLATELLRAAVAVAPTPGQKNSILPDVEKSYCKIPNIIETGILISLSEMLDFIMLDTHSPFLSQSGPDAVGLTMRTLQSAIISLALAPGLRLSENELCKTYGQGRGIVRAALSRLAHDGFVLSQPRSGWKVSSISAAGLREVIMARSRLEGLLADVPLNAAEISRIQTICDMQAALRAAPASLSYENGTIQRSYDRQIRDILVTKLKAPLIATWLANLWDRSERYQNYFERAGCGSAPHFDWTSFIDAKTLMKNDHARQLLEEGCVAFGRFAHASLLESDLIAPETAGEASKPRTAPQRQPAHPRERPSKRTI